jgi:hypothetical protein
MVFPKWKGSQNKIKSSVRKRKVLKAIALACILLFGKPRLSFSRSSSSNLDNQVVLERVIEERDMQVIKIDGKVKDGLSHKSSNHLIKTGSGILIGNDDREFNLLEENDQQVILVGRDSSGTSSNVPSNIGRWGESPSNFPTPPAGGRPSRPVYVPKYRTAPKLVDQGLGAAANPAGGGNGAGAPEFEDNSPVSKKEQPQESKTFDYEYRSNDSINKKQLAEQCELDENVKDAKIEIVYRIKENPALVREAERAGRDQAAQRSLNNLVEQLSLGNRNPGIGTENVFKDVYELRGKNRARVYYREVNGKIEILGKSVKSNQQKVINIFKKMYD